MYAETRTALKKQHAAMHRNNVSCTESTRDMGRLVKLASMAPTDHGPASTYRCGVRWCALIPSTGAPVSFVCRWSKQHMRRIWGAALGCLPWIRRRCFFPVNRYRGWLRMHEFVARPLRRGRCASLGVCDLYSKGTRPLHLKNTKP